MPRFLRVLGVSLSCVSSMFLWVLDEEFLGLSTSISLTAHTQNNIYVSVYAWLRPCLKAVLCQVVWLFPCVPLCFCDLPHSWCLLTPRSTESEKPLYKSQLWLVWRMNMNPCPLKQPQTRKKLTWRVRDTNLFLFCVHKQVFVDSLSGQRQTDPHGCVGIHLYCGNMHKCLFQWILNYLSGLEHL